jgi:hypothetical protein
MIPGGDAQRFVSVCPAASSIAAILNSVLAWPRSAKLDPSSNAPFVTAAAAAAARAPHERAVPGHCGNRETGESWGRRLGEDWERGGLVRIRIENTARDSSHKEFIAKRTPAHVHARFRDRGGALSRRGRRRERKPAIRASGAENA